MLKQHRKLRKVLIIIAAAALILLVGYSLISPKAYDVRTLKNDVYHQFKLNGMKDGLLVPIELKEDGEILFYTETSDSGKAVLEKKTGDNEWARVESSQRGTSYGIRVYADKGSYRIKAGPFHTCYLEFSAGEKRPFTPALSKEQAVRINEKFSRINWFTPSDTDSHWYYFTIDRDAEKTLTFSPFKNWTAFAFQIRLYDESENLIYEKEIAEDLSPNDNVEEFFTNTFSKGVYYMEVSKVNPESYGSYCIAFYY